MHLPAETYYDETMIYKVACALVLADTDGAYAGNLDDDAHARYPQARAVLDTLVMEGRLNELVVDGPPIPHQRRDR